MLVSITTRSPSIALVKLIRPNFWQKRNWLSLMLLPLSLLWWLGSFLRFKMRQKIPASVICIGNLVIGGAGKTPLCLAVGEWLRGRGYNVAYVSRGFGGSLSCAKQVYFVRKQSAHEVGDEALLLSMVAPTYICKNRYKAALAAHRDGAEIVIMDDGLQHRSLHHDIGLLVVDPNYGFGNRLLFPAGPLRSYSLRGVDAVVQFSTTSTCPIPVGRLPMFTPTLVAKCPEKWCGVTCVAFCGIASPNKFKSTLHSMGVKLKGFFSFPDHHFYTANELEHLVQEADGLPLLTTSKDYVKIPPKWRQHIEVVDVTLQGMDTLMQYVETRLLSYKDV